VQESTRPCHANRRAGAGSGQRVWTEVKLERARSIIDRVIPVLIAVGRPRGRGGYAGRALSETHPLLYPRGVSCVNDRPTGAPHHWVVKAILDGAVPALTGDPGIFVNAPELPIENSLTTLYTPLEQALHAWGT